MLGGLYVHDATWYQGWKVTEKIQRSWYTDCLTVHDCMDSMDWQPSIGIFSCLHNFQAMCGDVLEGNNGFLLHSEWRSAMMM